MDHDLVVQERQSGKQIGFSWTFFSLMMYLNYQEPRMIEKWGGGHS